MSKTEKLKFHLPAGTGLLAFIVLLVALIALNVLVGNLRLRRDFTAERLYTLSDGSRRVLSGLEAPVNLTLFFSRSHADVPIYIKDYADRVKDLLREYALASDHKVRFELRDPQPDSEHEEWAQRYGIEPQPTGPMAPPMYFGLVAIDSAGREQVLPTLHPHTEARLEYDLTRLITRTVNPAKPVLGVLSSLPVLGDQAPMMMGMPQRSRNQGWISFRELRHDFDMRSIDPDTDSLDPDLSALLIVHPKELPDATAYAIDRYLRNGGSLIVLLDPFSVAEFKQSEDNPMAMMGMDGPSPSEFNRFLAAWGVGFNPGQLVADLRAATRLGGGGRVEENPMFLSLVADNLNRDDIATANLDSIMLPFAAALTDRTPAELTFTPLIFSSTDAACEVDAMGAQFGLAAVREQLVPDGVRRVLAARLTGIFPSAFPNGPPEEAAGTEPESLAPRAGNVLLIGDADFLYDDFCIRMTDVMFGFQVPQLMNDNINFFVNAVEQMSGSPDLIAIRSRGPAARPFDKVDEIEFRAAREWQTREQELNNRLRETRRRLQELQTDSTEAQRLILSPDQMQAVATFREEEARIRRELREVRRNLRQDIDRLGVKLKTANILGIPLLVALFGLTRGWRRRGQ